MATEPRLQLNDIFLTTPEFQYRTAQEFSPRAATVTTMNTTSKTVVSTQFGSTSACVGCFLIPEDGNIRGQARQVVQYVVSTNTATVDAAWTSSTGVTTMRVWMPPEVPARATGTGLTTTVISSPHASVTAEPDDIYNGQGAFLLAGTGSNAGGAFRIVDFTSSTGTFSLVGDPLVSASADGDFFLVRKLLRVEGAPTVNLNQKTLERRVVGFRSADQAVPITTEAGIDFTLAQRPLTASAGNGTTATPPLEIGELLRDFMTETKDVGSTVSSWSSGSVTPAGGTQSIGGFILLANGEAGQVENSSGGVLTVPQSVTTVTTSSTLYAAAWYKAKTSGFYTRTFDNYRGRLERQYLAGCAPTCELQISRDNVIMFNFKYIAGEAFEYARGNPNSLSGHPISLYDTSIPVDGKGARVMLNGIRVLVGDIKINFGPKPFLRPCLSGVNQYDGAAFDFEPVRFTMTGYLADNDDITSQVAMADMLRTGNTVRFFYQKGTNPTETFVAAAPYLQITKANYQIENAEGAFSLEAQCIAPTLARGSSAVSTLPDFAIGWL